MKISCPLLLLSLVLLVSCSKSDSNPTMPPDTTVSHKIDSTTHNVDTIAVATYPEPILKDTSTFFAGVQIGTISDPAMKEASGLVASHYYPGMFWTHNDSGNPNILFLIDSTGTKRASFTVTGASNVDWEDIEIGPGPQDGVTYIYMGEIGDNKAIHYTSAVYRFPEPHATLSSGSITGATDKADKITFRYSTNGTIGSHNAETLLLDPKTKDLYVLSKELRAHAFYLPYPQSTDTIILAKEIANLPFNTLTGGDISPDGTEILLREYFAIYYWKLGAGETILQAFLRPPQNERYNIVEQQGEAICFSANADAFWTTSETANNVSAPLVRYKRK